VSTLSEAIVEALATHELDWRIDFGSPTGPDQCHRHVLFCSCGAEGYESDDQHRADVAIAAMAEWLEANEPQTDVGYESDGEDDLAWEWANGFHTGVDSTIDLVRKSLTSGQDSAKVSS
jgi:hypothetical protein